jgi:hypothetical protein
MSWEDKGNIPYVAFIMNAILAKWLDVEYNVPIEFNPLAKSQQYSLKYLQIIS